MQVQLAGCSDLFNPSLAHHSDAIRQRHRLLLVMGDVNHRLLTADHQAAQLRPQVLTQLGIQIAHRLIEQINEGVPQQGSGQGDALALAAGQL